ncbi:hypothetical protein C9374_011729 [Naegleria lovaniensis]|uniref:Uncharacterized protein n=1 Tax=Naegleria lovaniensis TaxID=51637 RepID=A0AA88GFW3_NAELO|nr:uncharacterized protein C9374_011729 [Naegleria lovaniensis]KAG2373844.1 hypothetical protein C9374_011729 [Naegleria lovaniensis]
MQQQVLSDAQLKKLRRKVTDRFTNKKYLPKPKIYNSLPTWLQHYYLVFGKTDLGEFKESTTWREQPCEAPMDENEQLEKRVEQTLDVVVKLLSFINSDMLAKQEEESDKIRAIMIKEEENNLNKKNNKMKHPKKSKTKLHGKECSTTYSAQTAQTTNAGVSKKACLNDTPSSNPLSSKDVQEVKPGSSLDGKALWVEQSNESKEGEEDNREVDYKDVSNQHEAEEPPRFANAVEGSESHRDLKSLILLKFDAIENRIITLENKIDNVHNTLEKKMDNIQNQVDRLAGSNYENYIRLNIIRKFDIPFQKFFSPLKLSKIDYDLEFHNAQVELEKRNWNDKVTLLTDKLSSDPPSIEFNFVGEKEDENIIVEATVQNITKEEVWKKKFLQLERQLTFYQHCKKTSVHRAVLVSPRDWTEEDFAKCVQQLKTMIPLLEALHSQNKFCYEQINDYHDI